MEKLIRTEWKHCCFVYMNMHFVIQAVENKAVKQMCFFAVQKRLRSMIVDILCNTMWVHLRV
jgi:hypothetical protein